MTQREMVAEFMRHIGSETPRSPTMRTAAIEGSRTQLILEELAETHKALLAVDLVGAADGLADLQYVVVGTAVAYGLLIADSFKEPVDLRFVCAEVDAASSLAVSTLPHLTMAVNSMATRDLVTLQVALEMLNEAVAISAASLGIPLREVFAEVHRSNMTKSAGNNIGAAKYPPGGKGPGYRPPKIAEILGA